MASKNDAFTLIGKRMQSNTRPAYQSEMLPIADLIRRIDHAVRERRAA